MHLTAPISNFSRGSFHDGPGLRTVVYFKGCDLRCQWCHNPESLHGHTEILFYTSKCIHCGKCVEVCPQHHIISGNDVLFLRHGCIRCGKCADVCPAGALIVCGEDMTVEQVMEQIRKDKHYYDVSHGGITLSGGECLLHADFSASLLACCKAEDIHTAVETALFVPWDSIEKVLPYTDLFYTDLKIANSDKHRKYTGHDNRLILNNLRKLTSTNKQVIIRIPLIPGVNDSLEDMDLFGNILKSINASAIELLRYNYMAESKYRAVGMEYVEFASQTQNDSIMTALQARLQKSVHCNVIYK